MGFLDSLFGKKPTKSDIATFNHYLFFEYIPNRLYDWANYKYPKNRDKEDFFDVKIDIYPELGFYPEFELNLYSLCRKKRAWKCLVRRTRVYNSRFKKFSDNDVIIIKAPSNGSIGEVNTAIIAIDLVGKIYSYITLEYSKEYYDVYATTENLRHRYVDKCRDADKFTIICEGLLAKKDLSSLSYNKQPSKTKTKVSQSQSLLQKPLVKKSVKESESKPDAYMPRNIIGKYYSLDQLRQVPMGQVRLQPIDGALVLDTSAQTLISVMAEATPDIKKYLPNLDLSSAKTVAKYFGNYYIKTEMGYEFGYSIKTGDNGFLGFIFVHTPAQNEVAINFPHWTIDFCLFSPFIGKGIMTQSIIRVLSILKSQMNVKDLFVYVDEDNSKCLNMLARLPFDKRLETLTDPTTGRKAILYCCSLSQINFQRR